VHFVTTLSIYINIIYVIFVSVGTVCLADILAPTFVLGASNYWYCSWAMLENLTTQCSYKTDSCSIQFHCLIWQIHYNIVGWLPMRESTWFTSVRVAHNNSIAYYMLTPLILTTVLHNIIEKPGISCLNWWAKRNTLIACMNFFSITKQYTI